MIKDDFIYSGDPDPAAYAQRQKKSIDQIKMGKQIEKQLDKKQKQRLMNQKKQTLQFQLMYELSEEQRVEDRVKEKEKYLQELGGVQKDFESRLDKLDAWVRGVKGMVQACGDLRERKINEWIEAKAEKGQNGESNGPEGSNRDHIAFEDIIEVKNLDLLNLKGIAHPDKQSLLKNTNEMLQDLANNNSINLKSDTLTWLRKYSDQNKGPVAFDIDAELSKHDYDEARYIDSLNLP